ncbi:unnamed protein product [Vitrella brassicaformis CCMP3155]|uniref:PDZ domain-containing protein n=1 Tax=Vitrella brassicaformis (strain CCMP3155) TaxID=1169540 RepID=A0A0G4EN63_VITBC|nr:unnamed protein product [Vitrella brassicaformis CCMP3155]|eukprot:CEL99277.1 unnamed protein product [Vitrella brassicaformis CCMP3155]
MGLIPLASNASVIGPENAAAAREHTVSLLSSRHQPVFLPRDSLLLSLRLDDDGVSSAEEKRLINEAWGVINRAFVDPSGSFSSRKWKEVREEVLKRPLTSREQTHEAIREMISSLNDPFTQFLSPKQYSRLLSAYKVGNGDTGIRVTVDLQRGFPVIESVRAASPAALQDLEKGDRIVSVDGAATSGLDAEALQMALAGDVGTSVTVGVISGRDGAARQVVLQRLSGQSTNASVRAISPSDRRFPLVDGRPTAIIRINRLSKDAAEELAALLDGYRPLPDVLVLDLRRNLGGNFESGAAVARLLLPGDALITSVEGRDGRIIEVYRTTDDGRYAREPSSVALLVDKNTASAAEVLAAALLENGRASAIGEKTYGKALIQSLVKLEDGSALRVTVGKYKTPDGNDINKRGIAPQRPGGDACVCSEEDVSVAAYIECLVGQ